MAWVSDGTTAGTYPLKTPTGTNYTQNGFPMSCGGFIYLNLQNSTSISSDIYRTDLTSPYPQYVGQLALSTSTISSVYTCDNNTTAMFLDSGLSVRPVLPIMALSLLLNFS